MGELDFSQFINDFKVDDLVYLFEVEFSGEQNIDFLLKQGFTENVVFLTKYGIIRWLKNKISKEQLIERICELDEAFKQRLMTDEEGYYKQAKSRLILKKLEQEFKNLLDTLEGSELTLLILNSMEDEQIRQILIDNLPEGEKQDIIDSYKR